MAGSELAQEGAESVDENDKNVAGGAQNSRDISWHLVQHEYQECDKDPEDRAAG
jgi:hypothetical protein